MQGYTLSPLIFNLYIKEAINSIKDRVDFGINAEAND